MYAVAEPWPIEFMQVLRDDRWLHSMLDGLWLTHFDDVPRENKVNISFARPWKARLGLITLSHDTANTYIAINGLLRERDVPEYVNIATVAHELVHYAHGFGSPLPQRYHHPHRGGIVTRELFARGLGAEQRAHHQWIHEHWHEMCARKLARKPVLARRASALAH